LNDEMLPKVEGDSPQHICKKIVINKIMEEWRRFWIFFPTILKRLGVWDYIIKIHVLDINALFDVHVIEHLDNSIFYWNP
jgi:hypothetical protein